MKTIYIDVYFLINFTVDLLALHFASVFTKVPIKNGRLVISSFLGALYASVIVFLPEKPILIVVLSVLSVLLISLVMVKDVSCVRRAKLITAFFLFMVIIGGLVYLAYCMIDRFFPDTLTSYIHNRRLLILSLIILLSIGILKLLFSFFFHANSEKAVTVMLELQGRSVQFEALVDSGNLLKDPIDLSPVMLIKEKTCISLFPFGLPKAYDSEISNHLKRYIRLIPITRNGKNDIYVGIRPDRACILSSGKWEDIRITVVIDEERGTFGGFDALMPSSAIEYI